MDWINNEVHRYAEKYSSQEDELLKELNEHTYQHHKEPHMLSGHLQGKLLQMVSRMIQPKRILEIGTYTGYSALCLASGLAESGLLHTIDINENDVSVAKSFVERSRYRDQLIFHIGEAEKIIGELNETWDLVFIDADKVNYINYFNLVLPRLTKNGFILADNVLFHGQVLTENVKGKNAKAIQAFNDYLLERTDVEKLLLPVRDGLMLIRKLH